MLLVGARNCVSSWSPGYTSLRTPSSCGNHVRPRWPRSWTGAGHGANSSHVSNPAAIVVANLEPPVGAALAQLAQQLTGTTGWGRRATATSLQAYRILCCRRRSGTAPHGSKQLPAAFGGHSHRWPPLWLLSVVQRWQATYELRTTALAVSCKVIDYYLAARACQSNIIHSAMSARRGHLYQPEVQRHIPDVPAWLVWLKVYRAVLSGVCSCAMSWHDPIRLKWKVAR